MIVTDHIKEKADPNYILYENNIIKYYGNQHRNFNTHGLTEYIYRFFVQADYASAHNHKYDSITSIHNYINNIYIAYYNHYKKKGAKTIITQKIIDDVLFTDNTVEFATILFLVNKTGYDKDIEEFLRISIESAKPLPKFALWEDNKNNIYVFLAILVDHVLSR